MPSHAWTIKSLSSCPPLALSIPPPRIALPSPREGAADEEMKEGRDRVAVGRGPVSPCSAARWCEAKERCCALTVSGAVDSRLSASLPLCPCALEVRPTSMAMATILFSCALLFALKGALQELKIFGELNPTHVQCLQSPEVGASFLSVRPSVRPSLHQQSDCHSSASQPASYTYSSLAKHTNINK